jgi:hypothetical protein
VEYQLTWTEDQSGHIEILHFDDKEQHKQSQ